MNQFMVCGLWFVVIPGSAFPTVSTTSSFDIHLFCLSLFHSSFFILHFSFPTVSTTFTFDILLFCLFLSHSFTSLWFVVYGFWLSLVRAFPFSFLILHSSFFISYCLSFSHSSFFISYCIFTFPSPPYDHT
jgi:hypothetical protein